MCEQWLKVMKKQLAGQECLIGVVEALADVLGQLGLVRGSLHGRTGGSRSDAKGKGKEKAIDGGSEEESGEDDGDGEKRKIMDIECRNPRRKKNIERER